MKSKIIIKFLEVLTSKKTVSKSNFLEFDVRNTVDYSLKQMINSWHRSIALPFIFALFLITGYTANAQLQGVAPVQTPTGGFHVDGNAYSNTPTPNIGDWFMGAGGTGGAILTPSGGFLHPNTYLFSDVWGANDPTTFTSSNKINDNPNTYTWGNGTSPNKNEIQNAGVHFSYGNPAIGGSSSQLWCMYAADRQVTNGDSYIDFEFLQKPLTMTGALFDSNGIVVGGSGGFITSGTQGGRTVGDLLVTIKFSNGGDAAVVEIQRWEAVGAAYQYVVHPNSEFLGSILITNNNVNTSVPFDVYGTTPGTYIPNQWAEGAINLSVLLGVGANPCELVSTLFIRTRTSGESNTSELKDFPGPPIALDLFLTPTVNAGADKVLTCTTTSIALSGSSTTTNAIYSWTASNGGHIVSGANTATPIVDAAGTYTLTVINPINTLCTATDVALVTLNNTPPNVNAGADKVLTCTTTSIALSGSSTTAGALFAWVASNGGNIVSGATTATPTVNAAGTYTLTVTSPANGCTATDVALVTLNNTPPNVNAGADKVLTCTTTSIVLSGSSTTPGATFAWVASNGGNIVSGATTATPTVNAAGTYTLTVTNPANGCTATDVALVTLNNTTPTVSAGEDTEISCGTSTVVLSGSSTTPNVIYTWVASNGGHIVSGATTATPTVNTAGTYILTVTSVENGCFASDEVLVTVQICTHFCTYTQGYFGNIGGMACTPDGQFTTTQLISNSISHMPNATLYLGRGSSAAASGGSFTANAADVAKLIAILPGGGPANALGGDYSPYNVQPLQNGRIKNVLLSQTITLALNLYMSSNPSESIGNLSLAGSGGKYMVTAARAYNSTCAEPIQADCLLQPSAIKSYYMPANVIAALPLNAHVWDLFQLAKNALGGQLPMGVSYSNVAAAVDAINVGFDKCRYFVEFADEAQLCPTVETIATKAMDKELELDGNKYIIDVEVYPIPFKDNLTLNYKFETNSPVTIEIFDIRGVLLSSQKDTNASINKELPLNLNFGILKSQVFFIKVTSDKGTVVKKVISK